MDAHEDLEEDLEEEEDEEWEEEWEEEEETQVVLGGPHGRTEYVLFRAPTMASAGYPSDADSHALGSGPGGGHPFELTFKFLRTDVKLVREVLEANGFRQTSAADFNVLWSGVTIKPHQLAELNAFQKVNRFPNMHEITRKDKLCRNLFRMREMHGARHFDFIPSTYVLPAEYDSLLAEHARVKDAVWIAKPCASSCGRGITIGAQLHHLPLDEPCVVSRYLTNPLLVDGFKFDMRLYVAVTCYEPLRLHLYEEGLARFATEKYHNSRYCLSNHYMHLTNYSVNKHSRNFVDNVDADADDYGNKWSLTALKRFLRKRGVPVELLFRRIDDLIVKTAISIEPHVLSALKAATPNRTSCFQLLGFDVFIDDALKPWLLEVNLGPSLATETPLDHRVKSSMLADLFTLCSFQPFDKRTLRDARRRHAAGAADRLSRGQPAYGRQSDQRALAAAAASMAPASAASAPRAPLGVPAEALAAEASYPAELRRALRENDEGDAKAGRWRRLFPAASSHAYLGFFDVDRPANVALADAYLRRYRAAKAAGIEPEQQTPRAEAHTPRAVTPAARPASARATRPQGRSAMAAAAGEAAAAAARNDSEEDSDASSAAGADSSAEEEVERRTARRPAPPSTSMARAPPRAQPLQPPPPRAQPPQPLQPPPRAPGAATWAGSAVGGSLELAASRRVLADALPRAQTARGARPAALPPSSVVAQVSALQARDAFSAYLHRVHRRLHAEVAALRGAAAADGEHAGEGGGAPVEGGGGRLDLAVLEQLVARHHCPAADAQLGAGGGGSAGSEGDEGARLARCLVLTQRLTSFVHSYDDQTERLAERTHTGLARGGERGSHAAARARADFRRWLEDVDDAQLESVLARFIQSVDLVADVEPRRPDTERARRRPAAGQLPPSAALGGGRPPPTSGGGAGALSGRPRPQSAALRPRAANPSLVHTPRAGGGTLAYEPAQSLGASGYGARAPASPRAELPRAREAARSAGAPHRIRAQSADIVARRRALEACYADVDPAGGAYAHGARATTRGDEATSEWSAGGASSLALAKFAERSGAIGSGYALPSYDRFSMYR